MHNPQKMMPFPEYIEALEGERRKIQVFHRELPLSFELITQAIEACKQQMSGTTTEYNLNGQSECNSEQTSTEEGPVFEEFIPIKKRHSPPPHERDEDDDDDEEQHSHHRSKIPRDDKRKSDWLRSVKLWNPNTSQPKEDHVPRKASVVEVKRNNGGAFQPFQKEKANNISNNINNNNKKNASPPPPPPTPTATVVNNGPASPLVPATSSTGPSCVAAGGIKKEERAQGQRKQRRCWSQELHKRFLHALQQLGGSDSATPKQIRELMKVDGLTNDEVKSHLQKFRLHTRRPSSMIPNSGNPQTPPLFLVGNIFVQPTEYAAVATASTASASAAAPSGICAHVAAHPPLTNPPMKRLEASENSHSDERGNHSEGAVHSNSAAASSCSTHTTTTTPGC